MQDRSVVVSFSGPWGFENSNIHIKCRIEFPARYPTSAAPNFEFEHTTLMSNEALDQVSTEVRTVVETHLIHRKSSLESSLRYLLGEQNLEDSLSWLQQRRESNDLGLAQDPALSSSDEDDEELGRITSLQTQAMELSDGTIAVSNALYNVPLPKACGALWADDGRLVCFFAPKEDRTPSLLDSLSLRTSDRSSKSRMTIFEGFGRLHNGSIIPDRMTSTIGGIGDADSDFDEESSTSSSRSSPSSEGHGVLRHHFLPSMAWRGSFAETQDAWSDSHKSSGGPGVVPPPILKSNNYIAIHDCSALLPSKRHLAREYVINGRGSDCCEANARVAEKNGDLDLASVWQLLRLVLQDEVPLERMSHPYRSEDAESIMVIARRVASPLRQRDSAVDLSYDSGQENIHIKRRGNIKWGHHPLGGRWLVDSL